MLLAPSTRSTLLAVLLVVAVSACAGNPDPTVDASPTVEYVELTAEGHDDGDGETEGHDLATGDNTPKDPSGRFFLHPGDRGPDVTVLQERLAALGADIGNADGEYGDHTLVAVLAFQTAQGLTPDGVVGSTTWAALDTPKAEVEWDLGEVPTEHATDAPRPTTDDAPVAPSTSAPAGQGDAVQGHRGIPTADDPAHQSTWAKAVVTLWNQTATFYDTAGSIVLQAPISSGKDHLTPTGTFHVQSKAPKAYSGSGNGVYMDWMTRFDGGIGFHSIPKEPDGEDIATPLGQVPVSHGCIRMHDDQARLVFENLPIGAVVEIHK